MVRDVVSKHGRRQSTVGTVNVELDIAQASELKGQCAYLRCTNFKVLSSNGACVDSCADGETVVGAGTDGRVPVETINGTEPSSPHHPSETKAPFPSILVSQSVSQGGFYL